MTQSINEKTAKFADEASLSSNTDASSDAEKFIGTQIVQESEHAIKYRTCSWQKVRIQSLAFATCAETRLADRRSPVLRVHLSRHLIIPLVCDPVDSLIQQHP